MKNRTPRPDRGWAFYGRLFAATFELSAFTFGGGFVIIPLMRKKFVEKFHWIEDREMMDLTAIAQSSPGAVAVNASILVGYRLAGLRGAYVSVLGTVLPPLVTLTLVSLFYDQFRDSRIVSFVLKGMQAAVVAVVLDVVYVLAKGIVKQRELISILLGALSFVATAVFHFNVVLILLACGLVGTGMTLTGHVPHDVEEVP